MHAFVNNKTAFNVSWKHILHWLLQLLKIPREKTRTRNHPSQNHSFVWRFFFPLLFFSPRVLIRLPWLPSMGFLAKRVPLGARDCIINSQAEWPMSEKDNQFLCHLYLFFPSSLTSAHLKTWHFLFSKMWAQMQKKLSSQPKAAIFHSYKMKKGIKKTTKNKSRNAHFPLNDQNKKPKKQLCWKHELILKIWTIIKRRRLFSRVNVTWSRSGTWISWASIADFLSIAYAV